MFVDDLAQSHPLLDESLVEGVKAVFNFLFLHLVIDLLFNELPDLGYLNFILAHLLCKAYISISFF